VEVLGPVNFDNVFIHMNQAAVVVTPSQSHFAEGFCKSAMEAFYTGTPVIAPDYGPFPFMVNHHDNGLLYTADDVNELASALKYFFSDAELRNKLRSGAQQKGRQLIKPETTFARAIERTFS
jgi:glycosyltransferase involved in cell wall biosynthesis